MHFHHQDHHRTMSGSPKLPKLMSHLHLPANTDQARLLRCCAQATPPTNHHHYHKLRWVSRCCAFKEGTTPMVSPSHVHTSSRNASAGRGPTQFGMPPRRHQCGPTNPSPTTKAALTSITIKEARKEAPFTSPLCTHSPHAARP
jgi:hypothetical protein